MLKKRYLISDFQIPHAITLSMKPERHHTGEEFIITFDKDAKNNREATIATSIPLQLTVKAIQSP